ncbi:MAG: hypothetical protein RL077_1551 [Verrucomicrobiota bacterium]
MPSAANSGKSRRIAAGRDWCSASGYSLKTDAVFLSMMAAAIQKSPGHAWGKNGFFLSPTSAWCPVSAVQPSVQSPQAFDTAETAQNRREYPRWFAPKPQPDRRIGFLFLCPHSFVMPRAPPIQHETIFREYRDALQQGLGRTLRSRPQPSGVRPLFAAFFFGNLNCPLPHKTRHRQQASRRRQDRGQRPSRPWAQE